MNSSQVAASEGCYLQHIKKKTCASTVQANQGFYNLQERLWHRLTSWEGTPIMEVVEAEEEVVLAVEEPELDQALLPVTIRIEDYALL